MLTVSFPVQELFHKHDFGQSVSCEINHNEECHQHKHHINEKQATEFCFLLHISKHFENVVFSIKLYKTLFFSFYSEACLKQFAFRVVIPFLRGPPLL